MLEERRRLKERILRDLKLLSEKLRERLGKVTLILYGSYARGDFNFWSDIDLILISEKFVGKRFIDRYELFEDLLKPGYEIKPYTLDEFTYLASKPSWSEALKNAVFIVDDYNVSRSNRKHHW